MYLLLVIVSAFVVGLLAGRWWALWIPLAGSVMYFLLTAVVAGADTGETPLWFAVIAFTIFVPTPVLVSAALGVALRGRLSRYWPVD